MRRPFAPDQKFLLPPSLDEWATARNHRGSPDTPSVVSYVLIEHTVSPTIVLFQDSEKSRLRWSGFFVCFGALVRRFCSENSLSVAGSSVGV